MDDIKPSDKAYDLEMIGDPWLCDCRNRVPISISGNISILTDFQTKLQVKDTAGINSDFSNIIFTDSSKSTVIDHWTQTYNDSIGIVWIEIPHLPLGGTTLYMYYEGCGSSGNPADVFDYWNDFDSATGIIDYRNGDFSVETYAGKSVLRKENNCDPNGAEIQVGFNFDDYILVAQATRPNDGSSHSGCGLDRFGIENSDYDGYSMRRNGHGGGDFGVERRRNGGGGNYVSTSVSIPRDTFVITELRRCSASNLNEAEIYQNNGSSIASVNSSIASHNYSNFDRIMVHGGYDYLIDYVAIAKFACTYPTYAFGTSESFSCDRRIWVNPFITTRARGIKVPAIN